MWSVRRGVRIRGVRKWQNLPRFTAFKSPSEADGPFDYVVCAHKAINQQEVPEHLRPAVGQDTTIVIIQNGVGNEEPFQHAFPKSTVISCVVSRPSASEKSHRLTKRRHG